MAKQPNFYGNFAVKNTEDVRFYTATASQTTFNVTYAVGYVSVYQNGRRLRNDLDFTAINGTSITLTTAATLGDDIVCIGRVAFTIPNAITQTFADARYAPIDTFTEQALTDNNPVTWNLDAGKFATLLTTSGVGSTRAIAAPTGTAPAAGTRISIAIIQDATGGRNYTWNAIFKFPGGVAPTYTPWPNSRDEYEFKYSGSAYQCVGISLDVR